MILLDADILLIELRYQNDSRFSVNRQLLDLLRDEEYETGITSQALLEVVGVLSFNVASARVPPLPVLLCTQFRLSVFPDLQHTTEFAGCTFQEIISQMCRQMAAGDAVQAVQIDRYAADAECLLTWNAKHFAGKLAVPVHTPSDWLTRSSSTNP